MSVVEFINTYLLKLNAMKTKHVCASKPLWINQKFPFVERPGVVCTGESSRQRRVSSINLFLSVSQQTFDILSVKHSVILSIK